MALKFQQRSFSNDGDSSCEDDEELVYKTVIMASSASNQLKKFRFRFPIFRRSLFSNETLCDKVVKTLLVRVQMPQTFFNGCDCDMIEKLSRMIRTATMQICGICVVMMVFEGSCRYTILNCCYSFDDEQFSSSDFIKSICELGECSFAAAGDEDEEDKCAICLEGFPSGSDADMLPCSHVYHNSCIMKWFEKSDKCPMCRFPCIPS